MSLTRFRYFFKVARLGSIREASEVLHVAPSAISRQIAKLEEEFGADLVEPKGRGITLTPAGEIVAKQAGQMVEALEQARSQIADLLGLRRGHVRLWAVEGSVGDLVMPALASFCKRYPAVTHELTVASTDRIVRALLEDEADLGFVFNAPELSELVSIGHGDDALYAIMHSRYPLLRTKAIALRELLPYPLALPDRTFGLRHMIDDAAGASRLKLQPALTTNSIEALRAFARTGAGITILPRSAVVSDIKRRTLRALPLTDRELRLARTTILARRDRQLPLAVTRLAEHVLQTVKVSAR